MQRRKAVDVPGQKTVDNHAGQEGAVSRGQTTTENFQSAESRNVENADSFSTSVLDDFKAEQAGLKDHREGKAGELSGKDEYGSRDDSDSGKGRIGDSTGKGSVTIHSENEGESFGDVCLLLVEPGW